MQLATVNGCSGSKVRCTVMEAAKSVAMPGQVVVLRYGGKTALGRFDEIGHWKSYQVGQPGVDVIDTSLHLIGVLDEGMQPGPCYTPPSGTPVEQATDREIVLFQDIYGIGWMLRHGVTV